MSLSFQSTPSLRGQRVNVGAYGLLLRTCYAPCRPLLRTVTQGPQPVALPNSVICISVICGKVLPEPTVYAAVHARACHIAETGQHPQSADALDFQLHCPPSFLLQPQSLEGWSSIPAALDLWVFGGAHASIIVP